MALKSFAKIYLNRWLSHINMRIDSLAAETTERKRLERLAADGQFENQVFPVPFQYDEASFEILVKESKRHRLRLGDFEDVHRNDVGFSYQNTYFSSPDVEILYAMLLKHRPRLVVEIGCGNSTKIIRQAILDGALTTRLIAIDPNPRQDISSLVDQLYLEHVEDLNESGLFETLEADDFLFIDSSHTIKCGSDANYLYLNVLPGLAPGAFVHIHDIFLPYDYPREWIVEEMWPWNEQYLIQLLLTFSNVFEVVWPAHYLQRTRRDFVEHFPRSKNRLASSLWLRKSTECMKHSVFPAIRNSILESQVRLENDS